MNECNECNTEFGKDDVVFECETCKEIFCSDCIDEHKKEHIEVQVEYECSECGQATGCICTNCSEPLCEDCGAEEHAENCVETEEYENIKEYEKDKIVTKLTKK